MCARYCLVVVALVAACGSDEQLFKSGFSPGKGDSLEGASPFALINDDIVIFDSGNWNRTVGCSGICIEEYSFWVTLGVKNRSYTKNVSIRWRLTDGQWQEAQASMDGTFSNDYEKWHVEVKVGQYTSRPEVKFAASVCYDNQCGDDQRSWANNHGDDYEVFGKYPTIGKPLKLMSHDATFQDGQARLAGTASTYPFAGQRALKVVYSLDSWATQPRVADATAAADGRSWTFEIIEPSSAADLPEKISFALVYEVTRDDDRLEAWANNGSYNFSAFLGPELHFDNPYGETAVCGLLDFKGATLQHATRVSAETICWDGVCSPGNHVTHSTAGDVNGAHGVEYRVTFDDGSSLVRQQTVTVSNSISTQPRRTSPVHVGVETNGVVRTAAGALIVAHGERDIVRHDPNGSTLPFAALPSQAFCKDLAIDDQDRVYAAALRDGDVVLYRFDSGGALDPTFGWSGELRLAWSVSSSLARIALAVTSNGIHIANGWYGSAKLYSYDLTGQQVETIDASYRVFNDIVGRDEELWVLTDDFRLIRLSEKLNDSGLLAGLEEVERLSLSIPRNSAIDAVQLGLADDGGLWVMGGSSAKTLLARTDASGSLLGIWYSGVSAAGAPEVDGWFDRRSSLFVQPDGSALVLNGSSPIFQTFSFAP